jgi:hypothetical protein
MEYEKSPYMEYRIIYGHLHDRHHNRDLQMTHLIISLIESSYSFYH